MRKLLSISCLLLVCSSFAATAQAQQITTTPAAVPAVEFKVDLTGTSTPVLDADQIATARALKKYDESMRNWSLPPEKLNEIASSVRIDAAQDRFRIKRDEELYVSRTGKELEWNRQRFADRVADSIYPGFGRIETTYANGASSRLDYIYTRRCGGRGGVGVCWQYRF